MSKKHKSSRPKPPKLSASQLRSPDTIPADELAVQRAEAEAEAVRRSRQRGLDLLSQGARLLMQGHVGEAADKLEQAAVLLPDDPDVAINLGGAYVLLRRHNQAVNVLERASRLAPQSAMVWTNLAAAYLGTLAISGPQQQAKAINAYEHALEFNPAAPNVHYNLGLIFQDRHDWSQARHYFNEALRVNPADSDARTWLARIDRLEQEEAALSIQKPDDLPDAAVL
ncbi:MAG: tetratricopeptide repeat protein [Anaerolineae bacterium]